MAVFVVNKSMHPRVRRDETVSVVAARGDLLNFEVVTMELIEPREIDKRDYREGDHILWPSVEGKTQKDYDEALNKLRAEVCGRTVIYAMHTGDLVIDDNLAHKQAGEGLGALVPKGKRAISIDLSKSNFNVSGIFVRPGDLVDILATTAAKMNAPAETKTILECVEILAVDQRPVVPKNVQLLGSVEPQRDAILRSVTVILEPAEVEKLESHKSNGTLTLSVRNPADTAEHAKTEAD